MKRNQSSVVWLGLTLISLGVAFILAQWIGWARIWPIFPILGGLALFLGYATSTPRDPGLLFAGAAGVLIGLFFCGFTLGRWEWSQMEQLWPVFLLIAGVAFLLMFLGGRGRDIGALGAALAAIIAGAVGLAFTHNLVGGEIVKYWPLLLILIGVASLLGGLLRGRGRR